MTKQQVQAQIDELQASLIPANKELSTASCKVKKIKNELAKKYKEFFEAKDEAPAAPAAPTDKPEKPAKK